MILKDPAVDSLSSFIGVDGTNTTLNSGRIQINLKPLEVTERRISASDVIRRLQPELAQVEGITLFMQPVQDLDGGRPRQPHAVPVQPGRCRREGTGRCGCRGFIDKACSQIPELRDVASDQQNGGCRRGW